MGLCVEGKISIVCYVTAAILTGLPQLSFYLDCDHLLCDFFRNPLFIHIFQCIILNIFVRLLFRGFAYQVAVRSTFLGYVFGLGVLVAFTSEASWQCLGIYMATLATFHYSEFLSIAWTNPSAAKVESFFLQHSLPYIVAACSSWLEFIFERYFFPTLKELSPVSYCGLILCIGGEVLRKMAMFTAKRNFNHIVQTEKTSDHVLVTHGVYKLCRHPSYVGWFYWSIGTQLILQNPFCLLAYVVASWRFFHDRVLLEEVTLLNFFGEAYVEYQTKVGTGLPFISGYRTDL